MLKFSIDTSSKGKGNLLFQVLKSSIVNGLVYCKKILKVPEKGSLSSITLFNIRIACYSVEETVDYIDFSIRDGQQIVHACMNAANTVLIHENNQARDSISAADVVSADGIAVVWASRLLKQPLPERVPGPNLMDRLVALADQRKYKIFLFGAEQEVVDKVAEIYVQKYGDDLVAGTHNGFFKPEEAVQIAHDINSSGAQFLFVAIPSPQKEIFNNQYRHLMPNIKLLMGVGGTFDVISGKTPRAPLWMQDHGLEWLFRLIKEPRRLWKRYLFGNTRFILIVMKAYWKLLVGKKNT